MYEAEGKTVTTWNPFVGCSYDCRYCYARDIAKRQRGRCWMCGGFIPHFHPTRLKRKFKIGEIVFVCSMGEISYAPFDVFTAILATIRNNPKATFYIQSKDPIYFSEYLVLGNIPENVVLGTTIETNWDMPEYSMAPITQYRYEAMVDLEHSIYLTMEPIMEFDFEIILDWIKNMNPEFVYIGYNSRDRDTMHLPEPALGKTMILIEELEKFTEVRQKLIRKSWWER